MNKEIEDLVKELGCKIYEGRIFAPEDYHFKSSRPDNVHVICLSNYDDEQVLTILKQGTECCCFRNCRGYSGGGRQCKFWASKDNQRIIRNNSVILSDVQMEQVLNLIKRLNDEGYDGLKCIDKLPVIIKGLELANETLRLVSSMLPQMTSERVTMVVNKLDDNLEKLKGN